MSALIHYSIEAAAISIIVYALMWRLMSKRDGRAPGNQPTLKVAISRLSNQRSADA